MTGDDAAFTAFYRRHAPHVFRFAFWLTGDRADAEDITSETFVRVWTSDTPVEETTVRAYLFTIARNLHLQSVRKERRNVSFPEELLDQRLDPHARAELRSEIDAAWEQIMRLAEIDRVALLMRVLDETPYEEIARTLNISVASAKVKVHRARLALAATRERPS